MAYIPFDELKQRASIEDAAVLLKLQLKPSGHSLRGKCPRCKGDDARALAVTPGKGFYCWTSHKGGDQIALVAHVLDVPLKDAAQVLAEHIGLETQNSSRNSTSTRNIVPEPESAAGKEGAKTLDPLSYLEFDHPAVAEVGFEAVDAQKLGIGFAPKGIMRGTVAVPVRLPDGTLVGYLGITEARLPKTWQWPEEPKNIVHFKPKSA